MFSPAPANIVTLTAPDKISRARWTFLARWQGYLGVLRGAAMLFWSVLVCQSAIAQYRAEIGYDALRRHGIARAKCVRALRESKQIVLDVRCRDCLGRYFNGEMQVSVFGVQGKQWRQASLLQQ